MEIPKELSDCIFVLFSKAKNNDSIKGAHAITGQRKRDNYAHIQKILLKRIQ